MLKRLKKMIIVAATGLFLVPMAGAAVVSAQDIQQGLDQGTCLSTTTGGCDTEPAESSVQRIIRTVINVFSLVVGVVSVIMIIVGGLKYITSGGDSGNVTSAKNTILYALIGLVIVAMAQVIVRFVLARATEG